MEGSDSAIQNLDFAAIWARLNLWVQQEVFSLAALGQATAILIAFIIAWLIAKAIRPRIETLIADVKLAPRFLSVAVSLTTYILWMILQWFGVLVAEAAELPARLMEIAVSLLTAWVVIRIASAVITNPMWSRFIATLAWTIAALNITELLVPLTGILDSFAMSFGDTRFSVLTVIQGILILIVLLWLA